MSLTRTVMLSKAELYKKYKLDSKPRCYKAIALSAKYDNNVTFKALQKGEAFIMNAIIEKAKNKEKNVRICSKELFDIIYCTNNSIEVSNIINDLIKIFKNNDYSINLYRESGIDSIPLNRMVLEVFW